MAMQAEPTQAHAVGLASAESPTIQVPASKDGYADAPVKERQSPPSWVSLANLRHQLNDRSGAGTSPLTTSERSATKFESKKGGTVRGKPF